MPVPKVQFKVYLETQLMWRIRLAAIDKDLRASEYVICLLQRHAEPRQRRHFMPPQYYCTRIHSTHIADGTPVSTGFCRGILCDSDTGEGARGVSGSRVEGACRWARNGAASVSCAVGECNAAHVTDGGGHLAETPAVGIAP